MVSLCYDSALLWRRSSGRSSRWSFSANPSVGCSLSPRSSWRRVAGSQEDNFRIFQARREFRKTFFEVGIGKMIIFAVWKLLPYGEKIGNDQSLHENHKCQGEHFLFLGPPSRRLETKNGVANILTSVSEPRTIVFFSLTRMAMLTVLLDLPVTFLSGS